MKAAIVPVTPFQQNCTILVDEASGAAAVFDPGGELDRILEGVKQLGGRLEKIFLTHGHIDHCGGAAELRRRTGLPVEGPHADDEFWISQLAAQAKRFGFDAAVESFQPDRWLADGDTVQVGDVSLEVCHCPGHTPGHVVFFQPEARLAMVGDVLFAGSIGRTDFPRGDHASLIRSIRTRLWPLGDDVRFIPGHGPTSTFGAERLTNPFVGEAAQARGKYF